MGAGAGKDDGDSGTTNAMSAEEVSNMLLLLPDNRNASLDECEESALRAVREISWCEVQEYRRSKIRFLSMAVEVLPGNDLLVDRRCLVASLISCKEVALEYLFSSSRFFLKAAAAAELRDTNLGLLMPVISCSFSSWPDGDTIDDAEFGFSGFLTDASPSFTLLDRIVVFVFGGQVAFCLVGEYAHCPQGMKCSRLLTPGGKNHIFLAFQDPSE